MTTDNKQALEDLQTATIALLLERIKKGEATAADLAVARQMLRDNGIEVRPAANPKALELADKLPFTADGEAA